MQLPKIYIVVPCYNEEEVLVETSRRLTKLLNALVAEDLVVSGSILFVDDGSRDETWSIIKELSETNLYVQGLKLSRNVGHQSALLAGLMLAKDHADCVVSIDADLQDDVDTIREFVLRYHEGFEVVYGVRRTRASDTMFKRGTAQWFYKFMKMLGVDLVYNHADFRLMSRRVVAELSKFQEVNLFLRGIIPLLGFKSTEVQYDRHERFAGESKYPLRKMLSFAFDGLTSFSVKPIRLITVVGVIVSLLSVILAVFAIVSKLTGHAETGWTSLMVSLWFIGGVQLISVGLIGEYIGKVYREVKRRPLYIIEQETQPQTLRAAHYDYISK